MRLPTVRALRCKMGNMTPDRFAAWKLYIRQNGQAFVHVPPQSLNQLSQWNMFRQEVLEQFPEMEAYDGQWPIEKYFAIYRVNERARRRCAPSRSSVTRSLREVTQPVSTPGRARVFIGKPPPRHHASSRVPFDQNSASYPRQISNPRSSLSSVTQVMTVDHVPVSPSSRGFSFVSAGHSRRSAPATYPAACLQCDHRPAVPPDFACEIRAISNSNDRMISALAVLGIVSDHHMRLFREFGTISFLNSIPLNILGLLYRTVLIKHLSTASKQYRTGDCPRLSSDPVQGNLSPFQQPPSDLERHIVYASPSALREAMGLENDIEGFERVVATIDNCLNDIATTDACEGRMLVNEICLKCPLLNNYQNRWPITTYIRWRRQQLCSQRLSGRPQDVNESNDNLGRTGSRQREQSTQGSDSTVAVPFTGCAMHKLPSLADACPRLWELLHSFGMQELLAVFLAVGIRSDEDLDLFRALDLGEKRNMFENLAHCNIKLNLFQEMMLGKMLEHL